MTGAIVPARAQAVNPPSASTVPTTEWQTELRDAATMKGRQAGAPFVMPPRPARPRPSRCHHHHYHPCHSPRTPRRPRSRTPQECPSPLRPRRHRCHLRCHRPQVRPQVPPRAQSPAPRSPQATPERPARPRRLTQWLPGVKRSERASDCSQRQSGEAPTRTHSSRASSLASWRSGKDSPRWTAMSTPTPTRLEQQQHTRTHSTHARKHARTHANAHARTIRERNGRKKQRRGRHSRTVVVAAPAR